MYRLLTFWICFLCTGLPAQDYFGAAIPFSVYNQPSAFTVGDMHNDGTLDVVAVGRNDGTRQGFVAVIFGRGDGSFLSKTELVSEYYPVDVIVDDLDKDGLPDIVTANAGSQTLSLFVNQGGGAFKLKENFKIKGEPARLSIGDYNKDGLRDLMVLMKGGRDIQIFKGTGKAQFKNVATVPLEFPAVAIQFRDYAGAGNDGLIVLHENETLVTLINPVEKSGKWTFQSARIDMFTKPVFAQMADINGDGWPDALTLSGGAMNVMWSAAGGLLLDQTVALDIPDEVVSFEVGDFNRDGHSDVAVLDPATAQILLYLNASTSTPKASATRPGIVILCDKDDAKPKTADVGMLAHIRHVNMSLFDGSGKLIRKYFEFDSDLPDGQFMLDWNGTDENDAEVPNGRYIFYYKLGALTVIRPLQKP